MKKFKTNIFRFINTILILFLLLMFDSCNPKKQITEKQQYIDYIEFPIEKFDSICHADVLDNNINLWHRIDLKDYETRNIITKYMYIKILNDSCNLIYIIENNKILKRKLYE